MFYCAFQKRSNSEVQKPTNVCVFAAVNHLSGPLRKPKLYFNTSSWLLKVQTSRVIENRCNPCYLPFPKWSAERWEKGGEAFSSYNAQYQPFHLRADKANSSLAEFIRLSLLFLVQPRKERFSWHLIKFTSIATGAGANLL